MRKLFCISLSIAAVVLQGIEARASTMDVTYAITGTADVPVVGTISNLTGMMTVSYRATTGVTSGPTGNVLHGPVLLLGATLMAPFNFTVFGSSTFTGSAAGGFAAGAGPAGLSSGMGNLVMPIAGGLSGMIHCAGAGCTGLGFPASNVMPAGFIINAVLNAPGVAPISGNILPVLPFSPFQLGVFQGFPVIGNLTATEVARHYVPEPSTLPLMAMGLAVLGVAGRRVVRRR